MTGAVDDTPSARELSLWRRLGWPTLGGAAATVLVGCGTLAGVLYVGVLPAAAEVAMVFALTAWIAIAAGPLSASSGDWFGAAGRGMILADAAIVPLFAAGVWGGGAVSWASGPKVYVLWLTLSAAIAMLTRLGRTSLARGAWAMGGSTVALLTLSSLFWSGGLLASVRGSGRDSTVLVVLAPNTAHGAARAIGYNWAEKGRIYDNITRVGQDFPAPSVPWWYPATIWAAIAAVAAGGVALRRGWRRGDRLPLVT